LRGLERHVALASVEERGTLRSKVAILRGRLWALEGAAARDDRSVCAAAARRRDDPATVPRLVTPTAGCRDATPIAEETVTWQFPAAAPGEWARAVAGEAWLRLEAAHGGRFEAHTRGSRGDTEIAVFTSCLAGALPVAVNDDGLGLQSAVGFSVEGGGQRWVRVRQLVGHAADALVLTLGGAETGIAGVVTETSTGDPIADTRVEIREAATGSFVGSAYTDSAGAYEVSGLTAGAYVANTRYAEGYLDELWDDLPCHGGCDETKGDPIVVVEGQVTSGIDFALLRAGAIRGRLRDLETGEALAGYSVRVVEAGGNYAGDDYTDAGGRYAVGGLSPGVHFAYTEGESEHRGEVYDDIPCLPVWPYCEPLDGTPIAVSAEETVPDIDFDLQRLGSIVGTLVEARGGAPIPFATLSLHDATGEWVGWADTDETGHYVVGGLEGGTYFATTNVYNGYRNEVYDDVPCSGQGSGTCDPLTGTPIAVTVGERTAGIDFALDRLGAIAGRVVDEASTTGIPFLRIQVWDAAGDYAGQPQSNSQGFYLAEDLAAGSYFATTSSESGYLDELYDDLPCAGPPEPACDPTSGMPIAVSLGELTEGIDFALTLGGGVTGALTDAVTGEPIESGYAVLWTASGLFIGDEPTNSAGVYRFDGLPGGTYFASSQTFGDYLEELYDDLPCPGGPPGCDPTAGTPVAVSVGITTSGVDFDLVLRGGLSGIVTSSSSGAPLPGVAIDVWNDSGGFVATGATNAAGVYQVDLSSGTFFVSTDAGHGRLDEVYDNVPCPAGPASLGLCDPLGGVAVPVIGAGPVLVGVDFTLAERLFLDGFESGDTSAWSVTVP
jgi:hypothetical protein